MQTACATVGINSEGARQLRFGENALFHLPDSGVVVRIARTMDYWSDAVKQVNVARWFAEHQFSAAQIFDVAQPVEIAGHPVTFWQYIPGRPGDRRETPALGAVLRRLHETPPPTRFTLPPEDILGRVEPRILASPIPDDDKQLLSDRLAYLSKKVPSLEFPLEPAPTHGDAHCANLRVDDGRYILIDFERFAWGQPEWDLAMTATEYVTAGWWTDEEYTKFADSYGYDVTTWTEGFDTLRAVHELKMTTRLMQNVAESPEIAEEYRARMRTLRGEPSPGWRPF